MSLRHRPAAHMALSSHRWQRSCGRCSPNRITPGPWPSSPWLKGDRHDRSDVLHSRHGHESSQGPRADAGVVGSPVCAPRLAHGPHRYEAARDRGTRGDGAGRHRRTRAHPGPGCGCMPEGWMLLAGAGPLPAQTGSQVASSTTSSPSLSNNALAIEHGVQIVLAPDIVGVALGAARHQDRVLRTLGSHDQARRHPGEPCRQVDHALPLGQRLGQHGRHGRRSDDHRRRAVCEGTGARRARSGGLPRGRGLFVNGIRTRASACTQGDSMPSHDRGAYGKNT